MEREDLRLAVYRSFVETGRAPSEPDLADALGWSDEQVRHGLVDLHRARHLVLDAGQERIVMAHPFSAVPLGFSVMGSSTLWWGGCAWDAFAVPHVVPGERQVLVATTCPACSRAHAWLVDDEAPPAGDQVAHFLVPAAHMWDDVVHTCRHQRLFCHPDCVASWLADTGQTEGYVMDLTTLWSLAAHWYDGRLERGYARREPEAAKEYLAGVGLSGPFWGL